MKYKHLRQHARGAKDDISFTEERDRWGATVLTACLRGETVAVVPGLQSAVAVKAAKRRVCAAQARSLKQDF